MGGWFSEKMNAMLPSTRSVAKIRCFIPLLHFFTIFHIVIKKKIKKKIRFYYCVALRISFLCIRFGQRSDRKRKITNTQTQARREVACKHIMTNANVQNASKKANAASKAQARVIAGIAYADRMRAHMSSAHTPTKAIKNAVTTASEQAHVDAMGALYAKAVAAVFDTKNADKMKAAIQALCARYDGRTPKRGYSEYYVHQYFEKLIKAEATTNAACYNYIVNVKVKNAAKVSASK